MLMRSAYGVLRIVVGGVVIVAWMMPAVTAGMTWYASTTAGGTFATLAGSSQTDFLHSHPLLDRHPGQHVVAVRVRHARARGRACATSPAR